MGNLNVKEWEISKLINAEYNPRVLKEHQFKQLKDSIERFGIVDPILVNVNKDRKGIIIGGHQRAYVCEKLGMKKIPAVELDLTLEQEKELNIRLNKNTGEWDYESLANYFDENELIDWGFQDYEFDKTWDNLDYIENAEEVSLDKDITLKIVIPFEYDDVEADIRSKVENLLKDYNGIKLQ